MPWPTGDKHRNWTGGRTIDGGGYVRILDHYHPRADSKGYVKEHTVIAEKVLGKPLPDGAKVHHANENRQDNRSSNLVICEDNAYHNLIHQRGRALKACGHAGWLKCSFCHEYDDPKNLYVFATRNKGYHRECKNKARRKEKS